MEKLDLNLEQLFSQAEERLKEGLEILERWSAEARDTLEHRPGVVLASLAVAGFVTGVLLRSGGAKSGTVASKLPPPLEQGIVFMVGAAAGITLGGRILGSERSRSLHPIAPVSPMHH